MMLSMITTPLISIIIPVYNAQRTIGRALDSLTNNDYDIEIIAVNDGSTDASEEIINQKMRKDKRIQQIVQENGGAARARNIGIQNTQGEYVLFCDADDEYSDGLLRCVIEDIEELTPDYIVFDRRTVYDNGTGFNWLRSQKCTLWEELSWPEYFNSILMKRNHSHVVFNKAYRLQIIKEHQIKFNEELTLCEDLYFNFTYLQYAKNMVEDGRAGYLQHKGSSSLTAGKRKDYYFQDIRVLDILAREYSDVIGQFDDFVHWHILHQAVHAIDRALIGRDASSLSEKREIVLSIVNDSKFQDAYKKAVRNVSDYERNKLVLIYHRLFFAYYLRYLYLPRIKGRWVQRNTVEHTTASDS